MTPFFNFGGVHFLHFFSFVMRALGLIASRALQTARTYKMKLCLC